jgi:hypothetical protein
MTAASNVDVDHDMVVRAAEELQGFELLCLAIATGDKLDGCEYGINQRNLESGAR